MFEKFLSFLESFKSNFISLSQLEALASSDTAYSNFSQDVQKLLDEGILIAVKKHGYNTKLPPLPLTYRIQKSYITQPLKEEILSTQLLLHPLIVLDSYLKMPESSWREDLPFIKKVNQFINTYGVPSQEATAPERSYQIVGDEKWIDEKGGKKLLETIEVWAYMKISSIADPLMIAINPNRILPAIGEHHHLIVENKTTFYSLLSEIQNSQYSSLVYGAGWKIVSGTDNLLKQIGHYNKPSTHIHHYFGDLDHEGISIWHSLYQKIQAIPVPELYQALLLKSYSIGKETQRVNQEAHQDFLAFFPENDRSLISNLLQQGYYVPQEAVSNEEICDYLTQANIVNWRNG